MDISTLMEIGGGNLKLEVTAADLTKFAKDVVDMTLAARSKELTKTGANAINGETYLSSGQVCEKLGIAKSTLWLYVPVDYPSGNSGSNADDTDKEDEV